MCSLSECLEVSFKHSRLFHVGPVNKCVPIRLKQKIAAFSSASRVDATLCRHCENYEAFGQVHDLTTCATSPCLRLCSQQAPGS